MFNYIKKILHSNSGATAIEYGLAATLISAVSITVLTTTGSNINSNFECVSKNLSSGICENSDRLVGTTSAQGWTGDIPVRAGETYEITFPNNMQYTLWDDGREWFNPDEGYANFQLLGIGTVITETKLSDMGVQFIDSDRQTRGQYLARASSFDNIAFHENGKLTITAQSDGYMNIGIHDSNAIDNWITYDGGITKTRDLQYTITRTN